MLLCARALEVGRRFEPRQAKTLTARFGKMPQSILAVLRTTAQSLAVGSSCARAIAHFRSRIRLALVLARGVERWR